MSARPGVQLARYLAQCGIAARRACDELIKAGRVTVNGQPGQPTTRVLPEQDEVALDGRPVRPEELHYYLLHKPAGYTCTAADPYAEQLAVELLHLPPDIHVNSVGRLDRESEGLLLFTNDGELAHRLLHPSYGIRKTYDVEVRGEVTAAGLDELRAGIEDEGERLRAVSTEVVDQWAGGAWLRIVVAEGRKREIRRMCRYLGLTVTALRRTHFGPLALGSWRPGHYRRLTAAELAALRQAVDLPLEGPSA
jgi:23S rRNA pseudouridine2605 synthase